MLRIGIRAHDVKADTFEGLVAEIAAEGMHCCQLAVPKAVKEFPTAKEVMTPGLAFYMKEVFASCGEHCYIEQPFYANWGGHHVSFGDYVYANFGLTLVDDGNIFIGDRVMFGPHVTVATANHPINPELRTRAYQYNKDVRIGNNVWIGAGAVIVPGVTIGDNSVIGAGSIVTKDIPANVVAVGNPCKVLREISGRDDEFFYKDEIIDDEMREIINEIRNKKEE